jgi:hypothetical protein
VNAELGFAASDQLGNVCALLELSLRPHIDCNAEPLDQLVEIDPARVGGFGIDIRDRRGSDERPFEGIDRSDVRQSRTHLDHQPMPTLARSVRLPATILPAPVRSSTAAGVMQGSSANS